MAKKKKSQRKRNFAYSGAPQTAVVSQGLKSNTARPAEVTKSAGIVTNKFEYVRNDIKTILVLALICVVVELVLWYFLHHSGVAKSIYGH